MASSLLGRINDIEKEEDALYQSPQLDRSMCPSEVLDATLGMQELKDSMVENQWCNSEVYGQDTFSHSVQIGGITMRKSYAIAQQFQYVTSANSTDQLRRVAQES